ncbi:PP2C family protein-serine/threonine phosphatase [Acidicapsa acidisoli]|uniref:PP2C family protein-serine/threonine phosphatase n=1 Tax=Acidicapsa acidisoli TaxID=1615681 RepID=UPI0021E08ED0|nr:PP2C family protein-serine/threonine phosphatase [Acidicapsa acidisoli]
MPRGLRIVVPILLGLYLSSACVSQPGTAEAAPAAKQAQTNNSSILSLGPGYIALNGPWRFATGDSPHAAQAATPLWAQPGFDDQRWETVDLTPQPGSSDPFNGDPAFVPGWTTSTHPGYIGWAWYRLKVPLAVLPGQELALLGPLRMTDAYQMYVNSKLVGSFGDFLADSGTPVAYFTHPVEFPLKDAATQSATPVMQTIAIRVWMGPVGFLHSPYAGGLNFAPLLGEAQAIHAQYELQWQVKLRELTYPPIEAVLLLVLALVLASLTFFDRSDPVYLWAAAVLVIAACADIALVLAALTFVLSSRAYFTIWEVFIIPLYLAGWVMVWWRWFHLRRPTWVPAAIAALTVAYMTSEALRENFLFYGHVPATLGFVFRFTPVLVRLIFLIFTMLIVTSGIRKQGREGWLVLTVIVPLALALFTSELIVLHLPVLWHPFGYDIFVGQIADLLLVMALTVLLLRRLLISVHRQRLLAQELMHAQQMQRAQIPETPPLIAGYAVTSSYRPAQEVGGDFFQIMQLDDGQTLIVLGDVSGKGLKAAMAVSMIVGAIRMAAETTTQPAEILAALNRRLLGRLQGAFATCLALRLNADGGCTMASAGHPRPYRNGSELELPGAFPLGLIAAVDYDESNLVLRPGDQLSLYTDGLLEARNGGGELYGFERLKALFAARPTAETAAQAAVAFGQDDDITVLTLTRIEAGERMAAGRLDAAFSPV